MAIFSVNRREFVKNLIDKGCHQAKTFTLEFSKFLREDLKRHFIRGYFDGDGTIYLAKMKDSERFSLILNIVSGSFSILESIREEKRKK